MNKNLMTLFLFQIFMIVSVTAQNSGSGTIFSEMKQQESELVSVDSALLMPNDQVKRIRIRDIGECSKLNNKIKEFPNLIEIKASFSELKIFPEFLKGATQIKILDLSHNFIAEIPIWIDSLINLEKLDLSNNDISNIPSNLFKLRNLTELNLRENSISKLSSEIRNLNELTVLDFYGNDLSKIPNEIQELKKIEILWLTNNYLSKKEIDKVKNLLPNAFMGMVQYPKQKQK